MTNISIKNTSLLLVFYLYLVFFEALLRRWILPEYSDVLLLVRDPIAIIVLFRSFPLL